MLRKVNVLYAVRMQVVVDANVESLQVWMRRDKSITDQHSVCQGTWCTTYIRRGPYLSNEWGKGKVCVGIWNCCVYVGVNGDDESDVDDEDESDTDDRMMKIINMK